MLNAVLLPDPADTGASFRTTRWSLIAALRQGSESQSAEAKEAICQATWGPLYAYARRKGWAKHDAEDAVQGFLSQLTQRGSMAMADQVKGKLRTFLLNSFQNYLTDQWRRQQTSRRGGRHLHVSLNAPGDENGGTHFEPSHSPEQAFLREWAQDILQRALDALHTKYDALGQSERLQVMLPFLPWNGAEESYAESAERLCITPSAFKSALFRLRSHYRSLLIAEVQSTLDTDDPNALDAEINELIAAIAT